MNKYRFWGLFSGISVLVLAFGAWKKIVHHPYADEFLTGGLIAFAISQGSLSLSKIYGFTEKK